MLWLRRSGQKIPLLGGPRIIEEEGGPIPFLRGHTGAMCITLASVAHQYARRVRLAVICSLNGLDTWSLPNVAYGSLRLALWQHDTHNRDDPYHAAL